MLDHEGIHEVVCLLLIFFAALEHTAAGFFPGMVLATAAVVALDVAEPLQTDFLRIINNK